MSYWCTAFLSIVERGNIQVMKKTAVTLGCAVLLFAAPAFAQSTNALLITQLMAQMQLLQAQIVALQTATLILPVPPAGASGAETSCPKLSKNFQRGARDASTNGEVTELQKFLSAHYNIDASQSVTGYFGAITQANVIKFQKESGLSAFGFVGPLTRAAIAQKCKPDEGGSSSNTPSITEPSAPNTEPAAPAPSAAKISVTSPTAVDSSFGQSAEMTISWQASGVPGDTIAKISLVPVLGDAILIAEKAVVNGAGLHQWTVPLSVVPGNYKIRMALNAAGSEIGSAESTSFAVTASNVLLSMSAPSAGSSYVRTQTMPITWVSVRGPNGSSIAIWLVNEAGANVANIQENTFWEGTYSYYIPADITPGQYQVKVVLKSSSSNEITSVQSGLFTINP